MKKIVASVRGMPDQWIADSNEWVKFGLLVVRMTDRGFEILQTQGEILIIVPEASNHLFVREESK